MSTIDFKLPELGEGVDQGTVVKLLVGQGDAVKAEQPLMEVEIDKATVELPSPHAGTIGAVKVSEGDTVTVGDLLLSIDAEGAAEESEEPTKAAAAPAPAEAESKTVEEEAAAAKSEPRAREGVAATAPAARGAAPRPREGGDGGRRTLPAGPAVRRLARMLGIDLGDVSGSGERGRITPDDVHSYVRSLAPGGNGAGAAPAPPLPDFSRWGPARAEPLSGVRKSTAQAMARAWSTIPHVTNHDLADVTDLEAGRKAFRKARPDVKVTMTVLAAKACAVALREYPDVGSSLDLGRNQQVFKDYVHIGIAVDTEHGLLVPVLRDVDKKSVVTLSAELTDLAERTRDRKVSREELQGAVFTISNLGGIGGTAFTPIVNWPQVAILGVSRADWRYRPDPPGQPKAQPVARLLLPLSLSYDHRLIDGAQAARFLRRVADLLEQPTTLLFHA